MSEYIKKTWADGEVITAEGLNNLETGVTEAKKEAEVARTETIGPERGGTGAKDGAAGLKNLLAAGPMVLSPNQHGDTLPEPGIPGRVFFLQASKKVDS